jgi:hypothetical protein
MSVKVVQLPKPQRQALECLAVADALRHVREQLLRLERAGLVFGDELAIVKQYANGVSDALVVIAQRLAIQETR